MSQSGGKPNLLVCLIEQNPLAGAFLGGVLGEDRSIRCLNGETASGTCVEQCPAVFVIDNCGLPLPLSEYSRQLRARYPDAKFVVIDTELANEEIVRLLWFGIDGLVAYESVVKTLSLAIHSVHEGQIWVPREALRDYMRCAEAVQHRRVRNVVQMTLRENQIIELVKRRFSNKEIAEILRIRESTVKYHLSHIYSKLQVGSRFDVVERTDRSIGLLRQGLMLQSLPVKATSL